MYTEHRAAPLSLDPSLDFVISQGISPWNFLRFNNWKCLGSMMATYRIAKTSLGWIKTRSILRKGVP